MRVDRPPPGEQWNPGAETAARDSACVVVLRDGTGGVEVLLVKRNPEARFMGGAWVFPGGSVGSEDAGLAEAGRRELLEEAGIALDAGTELLPFARWITPAQVKIRFDTRFFLARAPDGASAVPDGSECVDAGWWSPAAALAAHRRDELFLVFPTVKQLEELQEVESVAEALELARAREVVPVQPRIVPDGSGARVLMPGEPGYDEERA